jgi:hypothetical protein
MFHLEQNCLETGSNFQKEENETENKMSAALAVTYLLPRSLFSV